MRQCAYIMWCVVHTGHSRVWRIESPWTEDMVSHPSSLTITHSYFEFRHIPLCILLFISASSCASMRANGTELGGHVPRKSVPLLRSNSSMKAYIFRESTTESSGSICERIYNWISWQIVGELTQRTNTTKWVRALNEATTVSISPSPWLQLWLESEYNAMSFFNILTPFSSLGYTQ